MIGSTELPARAEILARLWGALAREPVPGITARRTAGADLVLRLDDGRELRGAQALARPLARPPAGFVVHYGHTGVPPEPVDDPVRLAQVLLPAGTRTDAFLRELADS